MRAFPHGDHVVLEGSPEELERVADAIDAATDDVTDAAGRIRRGLASDATRIAVERAGAEDAWRALLARDADELAEAVAAGLDVEDEEDLADLDDG